MINPEEQQTLVLAVELCGLTRIGGMVGVTKTTVKNWINKGIKHNNYLLLREALNERFNKIIG